MLSVEELQAARGVEHRVGDGERHVECALREQRPFQRVMDDVLPGEARVDVLRGDHLGVIVVPEGAGDLVVRVVVGLHHARRGQIGRVAVELRQGGRAVQVRRQRHRMSERGVRRGQVVAHRQLDASASFDLDGRRGGLSVVPDHRGEQTALDEGLVEGAHLHLVLLERFPVGVEALRERDELRHDRQRSGEPPRELRLGQLADP